MTVNDNDVDVLPIAENNYELEDIVELNPDEADENDIAVSYTHLYINSIFFDGNNYPGKCTYSG